MSGTTFRMMVVAVILLAIYAYGVKMGGKSIWIHINLTSCDILGEKQTVTVTSRTQLARLNNEYVK